MSRTFSPKVAQAVSEVVNNADSGVRVKKVSVEGRKEETNGGKVDSGGGGGDYAFTGVAPGSESEVSS